MGCYISDNDVLYAFNIWDVNSAKAIIDAASKLKRNVILQTSASIYEKIDIKAIRYFVTYYSKEKNIHAWLHLDNCKKMNIIDSAIINGYDSVMIDASNLPLYENIKITNEVVKKAHSKGVIVEAELGQIRGVEENIVHNKNDYVSLNNIDEFIENTNMDMIAVAFGNAHGAYKGTPKLNYEIVRYVTGKTDVPFVVHGGSGLSNDILKELMSIKGVNKINISTDVKMAYREGILKSLEQKLFDEDGFQALCIEDNIYNSIKKMAESKIKLLDEV